MKVIIISEALEEPFELDSDDPASYAAGMRNDLGYWYARAVEKKVAAICEAEEMRKATTREKHSIFRRDQ